MLDDLAEALLTDGFGILERSGDGTRLGEAVQSALAALEALKQHFAADHHVDQALTVNGSDRNRVDVTAVAQDADVAAQAEDFVQTVRDIDDGDALVAQLLDNAEHMP